MNDISPEDRASLLDALRHSDDMHRDERADRILWLSQHNMSPGLVMGRMEPMTLKQEASDSFVNGHFVATPFLAMAFIEHIVMDELLEAGAAKPGTTFVHALVLAKQHTRIDPALIDRAELLRLKRNPHAHRKPPGHEHSLGTRFKQGDVHPQVILQADAQEALELMFGFFRATLRAA